MEQQNLLSRAFKIAEVIDETKYEVLPKMPRHDSHVSDVIIILYAYLSETYVLNNLSFSVVAECEIC